MTIGSIFIIDKTHSLYVLDFVFSLKPCEDKVLYDGQCYSPVAISTPFSDTIAKEACSSMTKVYKEGAGASLSQLQNQGIAIFFKFSFLLTQKSLTLKPFAF